MPPTTSRWSRQRTGRSVWPSRSSELATTSATKVKSRPTSRTRPVTTWKRPIARCAASLVVVQAGGVEHVQDRRPERLAEVAVLRRRRSGRARRCRAGRPPPRRPAGRRAPASFRSLVSASARLSLWQVHVAWETGGVLDERWIRSLHVETLREEELHAEREPHVLFQASTIGGAARGRLRGRPQLRRAGRARRPRPGDAERARRRDDRPRRRASSAPTSTGAVQRSTPRRGRRSRW